METIKYLELNDNFEIINCTKIKNINQQIIGAKILNKSISSGGILLTEKNNIKKIIEIDKITQVNESEYKLINSNITIIIRKI